MRPIYAIAILGVLFVLYTESQNSTTAAIAASNTAAANAAAAASAADYGNTTGGIISSLAGVGQDAFNDFSDYGID